QPLAPAQPLPQPPGRSQPSMTAPKGGYRRYDDPRDDEPTSSFSPGTRDPFDGFESGRHCKTDMTTEIRMPPDLGPSSPAPVGGFGGPVSSGPGGGFGGPVSGGPAGPGTAGGEVHRID